MKTSFNIRQILLLIVIILAISLRFWNLGSVPPSASLDEASIGYNAYSVSKIGVDEYGNFPLISQRGYDDYRRSTYLLFVVPSVSLFGLNATAVRLPAVILSVLTVLATYYLVLSLFSRRSDLALNVALFATLLLAISPWHIYISRLGHESNACLSFLVFGALFFLQGVKRKNWILILISLTFFTLSMISYYSGQVFIPLFVGSLFLIFRKNLLTMASLNKKILIPFFIFLILLVPIFWSIFSPVALIRFQGTSTFKPEAHWAEFQQLVGLRNKAEKEKNIIGTVIYNRRLFPVYVFTQGYFAHFNPKWLFANSSAEPHKVPNMGLLYIWEIPLIIIGIFFLIFSRKIDLKYKIIIFLWFFLGPLPASIATQTPHAMRSYNFLPMWQIIAAFGLAYVFYLLRKFKFIVIFIFIFLIGISVFTFYNNYYIVFPKTQSSSFQYALSKAIPFVSKNEKNYDRIVFSNRDNLYQSYMFFLFYNKYDPILYLWQGGTKSGGFAENHKFGKYEFRPISLNNSTEERKTLLIGNIKDFPVSQDSLGIFSNLGGEKEIKIVSNE